MKQKEIIPVIIILILTGAGFFIFKNQNQIAPTPSPSASPSSTTTSGIDLGSGGSSYSDKNNIFTLLYPNDYIIDTDDPLHIRIFKRAPTQRPQSEISDGALMVLESIDLKGSSLESWVDERIKQSIADGTSEITEAKKSVTQNGYPGFHYAIRGLGISQNLILQKDKNSKYGVMITYFVSDPKNIGYQKEIDAILASLNFLK